MKVLFLYPLWTGETKGISKYFAKTSGGTYIPYNAVAIGAGSDTVTEFLKKYYKPEMPLEESQLLAISSISMTSSDVKGSDHIKISQIK